MPSPTEITVSQLARLVGLPQGPVIVDVRTDEDYAADPRLLPGVLRRGAQDATSWGRQLAGKSAIIVCQRGAKLGQGPMFRSGKQLSARVAHLHERARRTLARSSKFQTKEMTEVIWNRHKAEMTALRDRQAAERQSERDGQVNRRKSVSFEMAKASIVAERAAAPRAFSKAPEPNPVREAAPRPERFHEAQAPPKATGPIDVQQDFQRAMVATSPAALSRAGQIKRDMAAWRRRNEGKDFGREMWSLAEKPQAFGFLRRFRNTLEADDGRYGS